MMRPSRRFLLILLCCQAIALAAAPNSARAEEAPEQARTVIGRVIHAATALASGGDRRRGQETLRASIDIDAIAAMTLGQRWREATAAERDTFRDALFASLAYDIERRVGARTVAAPQIDQWRRLGNGDGLAATRIAADGRDRSVDWRLRGSGAGLRVVDIAVDGFSLVASAREEFLGLLNRNGGSIGELAGRLLSRIPQDRL